jgi:putative transcriptional regulator
MIFRKKKQEKKNNLIINRDDGSLTGKLLIAKPGLEDHRFSKSVVYICAHNQKGAMGIVVNRLYGSMNLSSLLDQLNIPSLHVQNDLPVFFGGPMESARGFVLHSSETNYEGTLHIDDSFSMTATVDILKALGSGKGPHRNLLALGHAGWGNGELDKEIAEGGWLITNPTPDLIFDMELDTKWVRSFKTLGASDISMISHFSGKA